MTFEKLFVSLDMLAPPIELSVAGQKAYRTKFGGILTVCLLGFLTTAMFFILKQALRTDIPISYQELMTSKDYPTFNLMESNHIPVLAFYANETETMTTDMFPKYFTADCMQVIWNGSTDAAGQYTMQRHVALFPVKPCKELEEKDKRYLNYIDRDSAFVTLIEDSGICVVPDENFWISGKNSDDVFVELVFRLRPCSLATGCASYAEVSKVNFYLGLPNTNIDLTNYENPYSQSLTADDLYYINPNINQRMRLSLRTVDLWDLSTLFPTWMKKLSFPEISRTFVTSTARKPNTLSCSPNVISLIDDTEDCESYLQFNFQSSGSSVKVKRRYKTYTEVLGEISGVKGLLIMGFAFLYVWPNKRSFKKFISQKLGSNLNSDYYQNQPKVATETPSIPTSKVKPEWTGSTSTDSRKVSNSDPVHIFSNNAHDTSTINLKDNRDVEQRNENTDSKKSFVTSCLDIFKVCIRGTTVSSEDQSLADTLDVIWMIRELHKWRILGQLIFDKDQMTKLPRIVAKMQQNPELGFEELEKSPLINNFRRELSDIVESLHSKPLRAEQEGPIFPHPAPSKLKLKHQTQTQSKTQEELQTTKISVSAKDSSKPPDALNVHASAETDSGAAIVIKNFANEERIKHVARRVPKATAGAALVPGQQPPSSRSLLQVGPSKPGRSKTARAPRYL